MNALDFVRFGGDAESKHVDPTKFTLEELSVIKGAMWCTRLKLPFGPRPNQDDNILAMDYYEYYHPEDKKRMIDCYVGEKKLTHCVTGPLVDPDGYHGLYPTHPNVPTQEEFDEYLDSIQELWDANIKPIHFCHPDNWSLADMDRLNSLYRQDRAQKILRIVVYTGWEPTRYDWSNSDWVAFLKKGKEIFPDALRLVHTVADCDALTGQDDDKKGLTNAQCWINTVPYLHGWLVQNGGYVFSEDVVPTNEFKKNFSDQFNLNSNGSLMQRFHYGYAGWPTSSAWGNKPIKVYAAEYAAYIDFWKNAPEKYAIELGNLAMKAGADGFLDSGSG